MASLDVPVVAWTATIALVAALFAVDLFLSGRRPHAVSCALGIEEQIVNLWKLRRGKCVELRIFSTMEEALEATEGPA